MNTAIAKQSNGFSMQPANMQEAMSMADILSKSNLVPKNYKGNSGDTLVAMMMGSELGLNPIQSLQNIAVINGKPSIYGDALLALVQNHPSFKSIVETFDETTMAATCVVTRKGGKAHTETFSQADAKTAGLWGKQGPWTQYPKRMLAMRSRGFALRNQFADALLGLITAEEAQDMPDEIEINPAKVIEIVKAHEQPYPDDDFKKNFPIWSKAIMAGKKNHKEIISIVSTKGELNEEQLMQINDIGVTQ